MVKDTKKIKIYSIAAYRLFERCFKRAGILPNGELVKKNWSHALRDAIETEVGTGYDENDLENYNNYLRDRFNLAEKNIRNGVPKELIGFYIGKIEPLIKYADISDIDIFNGEFDGYDSGAGGNGNNDIGFLLNTEPIMIPVFYSSSKLGLKNILLSPDNGMIYIYPNGDLVFEGEKLLFIRKAELRESSLQSTRDDQVNWIKAEFVKDGHVRNAYFIEIDPESGTVAKTSDKLLGYLSPAKP